MQRAAIMRGERNKRHIASSKKDIRHPQALMKIQGSASERKGSRESIAQGWYILCMNL